MATKDKGGSKSRKKTPTKTLKQKRQTNKAKQAGGTAKVMRRIRVDDAARAARAAPQGSRHVRVVAIPVLGSSGLT